MVIKTENSVTAVKYGNDKLVYMEEMFEKNDIDFWVVDGYVKLNKTQTIRKYLN